jgi:hypothetical protein
VVVGCLQPVNWESCWPPTWLIPYVYDLADYYSTKPYSKEQDYLDQVN